MKHSTWRPLVMMTMLIVTIACGGNTLSSKSQTTKHPATEATPSTGTSKSNTNTMSHSGNSNTGSSPSAPSHSDAIQTVSDPTSITVLVNKTHKLPNGYVPPHLVYPNVPFPYSDKVEKRELRQVAATALENMFAAANHDGIHLYAQSGYRSYTTQKAIFAYNVKNQGYKEASIVSAHPGTSEHQTGLAIDITSADVNDELIQKFGDTPEGQWVAAHAHNYGFIIRYPKGDQSLTGYEYEPWHIRYVGRRIATEIYKHHWTLEQYISQKGK